MDEDNPNNRYRTPFDTIRDIKYFAWCQKARMKSIVALEQFMHAVDEDPDTSPLKHHRIRLPQMQCQGKKKYKSWRHANSSLIARKYYNTATGGKEYMNTIRPYHCEHCGFWHLGHRPNT